MKSETVPAGVAIWQSDDAKSYRCPTCTRVLFTQHTGDDQPTRIVCNGPMADHVVEWDGDEVTLQCPTCLQPVVTRRQGSGDPILLACNGANGHSVGWMSGGGAYGPPGGADAGFPVVIGKG